MSILSASDHLGGQQMHALAEGDLLIVEGVDVLEELLDQLHGDNFQPPHECPELLLINHAVVVEVDCAELLREPGEELLMLTELEVQHGLQEGAELQLVLGCRLLLCDLPHLIPCQFFIQRGCCLRGSCRRRCYWPLCFCSLEDVVSIVLQSTSLR